MKNRESIVTIKSFENATGFHFTMNHTGKMEGLFSASTSCLCNPFCKARMNDDSCICSHCFSAAMHKRYSNLAKCLEKNFEILTSRLFHYDELPMINAAFFRIESFGDIYNVTQARNYLRLIKRNPQTFFAFFTKNPNILKQAIEFEGKPENCNVILSNPRMNTFYNPVEWTFVDKIFSVYDKAENAPFINCGSRKCMECRICYTKNETRLINEILK